MAPDSLLSFVVSSSACELAKASEIDVERKMKINGSFFVNFQALQKKNL